MTKTIRLMGASLLFATCFMVTAVAQARQLYWTGQGGGHTSYECKQWAIDNGESEVRWDCKQKGYSQYTCDNAAIVRTEGYSESWYNGYASCSIRVYIELP